MKRILLLAIIAILLSSCGANRYCKGINPKYIGKSRY